jgi:hypothetical protein
MVGSYEEGCKLIWMNDIYMKIVGMESGNVIL